MTTALTILVCSTLTLACIAGVFRVEDAQEGQRIIFKRTRAGFDWLVLVCIGLYTNTRNYLSKSIFRLMYHYGAHTVLSRVHALTQRIHIRIEKAMRQNKQIARTIRSQKERNHLDEIADHKEETALSQEERERRRSYE